MATTATHSIVVRCDTLAEFTVCMALLEAQKIIGNPKVAQLSSVQSQLRINAVFETETLDMADYQ